MKETAGPDFASSRRALLRNLVLLTGAGAGASMLGLEATSLREVFVQAAGAGGGRGNAASQGMQLILPGTQGGPNLNRTRAETTSVVVVDGQPYLVDCGYGAVRSLVDAGITLNSEVKKTFNGPVIVGRDQLHIPQD